MTRKSQKELCLGCHTGQADMAKTAKSVHPPFQSGDCTACHSPHRATLKSLLLAQSPDSCLNCHKALKERMQTGKVHPPAQQDCTKCHEVHSSDYPKLVNDDVQKLCATCHKATDGGFRKAHLQIDAKGMRCTGCHDPHQSKDPALLNATIHPPFQARQCDACHVSGKR
jgi:predicted CXXCH cytochrome family protein